MTDEQIVEYISKLAPATEREVRKELYHLRMYTQAGLDMIVTIVCCGKSIADAVIGMDDYNENNENNA